MATKTNSANGTPTAAEMKEWFEKNKRNIENFAKSQDVNYTLRDVTKPTVRDIRTIDKERLKGWIDNISSNEKNLRTVSRFLYYRSNLYFRIISWYSDMWDLRCRKVVPKYDLTKPTDEAKFMKSYNDTLDILDRFNLQSNMVEVLTNVYIEDIYYGIRYTDKTGTFFYRLEPDECMIDGRYSTSDFSYAVDMTKWKSAQRKKIIEYIGSPLKEMLEEHERTKQRWIHMPDEYAVCLKYRTDLWDTCIPPLLSTFLQLASLEDLIDIQAEADKLDIYKLIYMPIETLSGTKNVDDWAINPATAQKYFKMLVDGALPDNIGAAIVPGSELKTIEFDKSADSDTNSVEKSQNQIMATAGGGAVINANNITSTAAFNAWLESETQFALSTLIGQINGMTNRWLSYEISNPAKVEHFEVSVYTKEKFANQLLESCKYSYSNRLAYNTCLGISEKDTMAMEYLESQILKLPTLQIHPLNSSFTQSGTSGEVGDGAPVKDDSELTPEGERSRNR